MCIRELEWAAHPYPDWADAQGAPLNNARVTCRSCGRLDLDTVSLPYYIDRYNTPRRNEMAPAIAGNFLVRERVKRVFELAVPDQCAFYPTTYSDRAEQSPWWLAVPQYQVDTVSVIAGTARCGKCGQSLVTPWNTSARHASLAADSTIHVAKAVQWERASGERARPAPTTRRLYLSAWLYGLLEEIETHSQSVIVPHATRGVEPLYCWQKHLAELVTIAGPIHEAVVEMERGMWLETFLRTVEKEGAESKRNGPLWSGLPRQYKDFLARVADFCFGLPGDPRPAYRVTAPQIVDDEGRTLGTPHESTGFDRTAGSIAFAFDGAGNCLCFKRETSDSAWPVFEYQRETGGFTLFADDFPACVRRLWHKAVA